MENKQITVTENEIKVLEGIVESCFHDGRPPVDDPVWSFSANPYEGDEKKKYPGVCSSLSKKGLAGFQKGDEGPTSDIVWITAAGMEALKAAKNKAETEGNTMKKAEKKQDTVKKTKKPSQTKGKKAAKKTEEKTTDIGKMIFKKGDNVDWKGNPGEVTAIGAKAITVKLFDGKIISVPASSLNPAKPALNKKTADEEPVTVDTKEQATEHKITSDPKNETKPRKEKYEFRTGAYTIRNKDKSVNMVIHDQNGLKITRMTDENWNDLPTKWQAAADYLGIKRPVPEGSKTRYSAYELIRQINYKGATHTIERLDGPAAE
jgi:hypothetical protein